MSETDDADWRTEATNLQCKFAKILHQPILIEESDLFKLKIKVGFATCGKPSLQSSKANILGYKKDEECEINKICNQIIKKGGSYPFNVAKTVVILRKRHGKKSSCCPITLFRIETKDGNIFIDNQARVYKNWQHYTKTNNLPVTEYCYPVNGVYTNFGPHRKPVKFSETPSSGFISRATDTLDTVVATGTVLGGAAVAVGVGTVCLAPTLVVSGIYGCARGIATLCDRREHDQPCDLGDSEARKSWYNIVSPAVAGVNAAAVKVTKKAVEGGKSVPKALKIFTKATAVTSVAISGFGFVDTLYICWDKKKKHRLTKYDIFCLISESLFFYNAIVSLKKTWDFVDNVAVLDEAGPVGDASTGAIQLSSFDLLKACPPGVADVIFRCDNIAHDTYCWLRGDMGLLSFLKNTAGNLKFLYDNCFQLIGELFQRIWNWLLQLGRTFKRIYVDNVESTRRMFGCKISNLENELNETVLAAEDSIQIVTESVDENTNDDRGDEGGEELKKETRDVLTVVVNLIDESVFSANDIQEFNCILDAVKLHVITEFNRKIKVYSKGLEAVKELLGDKFDAKKYNEKMGVKGNAASYFFKETIEEAMAKRGILLIRSKMDKLRKELPNNTTEVWKGLAEGMFYYSFPIGESHASLKTQLMDIIGKIINTSLSENMLEWHEHDDYIFIRLLNDENITINAYNVMLSEHTANGLIMIVQ